MRLLTARLQPCYDPFVATERGGKRKRRKTKESKVIPSFPVIAPMVTPTAAVINSPEPPDLTLIRMERVKLTLREMTGSEDVPSIYKLARAAGLSPTMVSRVLGKKRRPSLSSAVRIASALGISLDTLTKHVTLEPSSA